MEGEKSSIGAPSPAQCCRLRAQVPGGGCSPQIHRTVPSPHSPIPPSWKCLKWRSQEEGWGRTPVPGDGGACRQHRGPGSGCRQRGHRPGGPAALAVPPTRLMPPRGTPGSVPTGPQPSSVPPEDEQSSVPPRRPKLGTTSSVLVPLGLPIGLVAPRAQRYLGVLSGSVPPGTQSHQQHPVPPGGTYRISKAQGSVTPGGALCLSITGGSVTPWGARCLGTTGGLVPPGAQ